MASTNWLKVKTSGEAKAMLRHCDTTERLAHNHANPDIDKAQTGANWAYMGLDYTAACKRYDDRIAALDALPGANRRKDRVTLVGLEAAVPEGIAGDTAREDAWARDYLEIARERYGADNIVEAYFHRDEIHDYVDRGEIKTSRGHLHLFVVPEWDGKLNARALVTKGEMRGLNNQVDEMTRARYGCPYMTGEAARGLTVESLKAQSARDLALWEAYEEMEGEIEAARQEARDIVIEAAAERANQKRLTIKARGEWIEAMKARQAAKTQEAEATKAAVEARETFGEARETLAQAQDARRRWAGMIADLPQWQRDAAKRRYGKAQEAATQTTRGAAARVMAQAEQWDERDKGRGHGPGFEK